MGTLAIDIETASPDEEPAYDEFDNTDYFELVAVALGYRVDDSSSVESAVLFRDGGWEEEHTADLLERVAEWLGRREISEVLTYNGAGFDFIHLRNWAEETDDLGLTDGVSECFRSLDSQQIDLAVPSADYHTDLSFEAVCEARNISVTETEYEDYEIDSEFFHDLGIDEDELKGKHVGTYLGEEYVTGVTRGLEEVPLYQELKNMLLDYAEEDAIRLFDLYDSFNESDCKRVSSQSQQ
ncbi:hypothetical protein [Halorussus caseinilyticus]|uniref:Uncharacterized protein n=1 Tax=Halorussus caseinilyticus TaxID=3034025 RepID=A0ABD5WKR8_9EURY|nr:hypothetical protein [Halorussus sp. DT72]